ncbi:MAG: mechanosensitive ion channel [Deltaproteobacteria bacterium]|nr:mechanosensitive ion channel [Deltaproteobacteria bacterium]
MIQALESDLSLLAAGLVLLLAAGLHALARSPSTRADVRGAMAWLVVYYALRIPDLFLQGPAVTLPRKLLDVAWMVALSFGLIRFCVSLLILTLRARSGGEVPKILRDVLDMVLYAAAALAIIRAELQVDITGLLATSAILSVVLGLALQDTLGNLFAGLSLQFEQPCRVGDWLKASDYTGRVAQVTWRSTRIETRRGEHVTLPNSLISRGALQNCSRRDGVAVGVDVPLGLAYEAPPNRVKAALLEAAAGTPGTVASTAPQVAVLSFDDSAIRYRVRLFVADWADADWATDEFLSRAWYRLRREGVEIPYPQRTVHLRPQAEAPGYSAAQVDAVLRRVEILSVLTEAERRHVASELRPRWFGRGEQVIEQGAPGQTFYVVAEGTVAVLTGKPTVEVARLSTGATFGEMSLLTGEPRAATVVAATDALLLELDRPTFAQLFAGHDGLAPELARVLAERRSQLDSAAAQPGAQGAEPEAHRILGRLRQIFSLRAA